MSFADLPYGFTDNKWDTRLDTDNVLAETCRILTKGGASLYSASGAFASVLIAKLGSHFRYDLVWDKKRVSGFLNAYRAPLRRHEWIIVSGEKIKTYNIVKELASSDKNQSGQKVTSRTKTPNYQKADRPKAYVYTSERFPSSVLTCSYTAKERGVHPTQKPIALLTRLIKTYSNPGDTVFDPVAGSFTTAVSACLNGRSSVCIEKDPTYFDAGVERVRKVVKDGNMDVKIEVRR